MFYSVVFVFAVVYNFDFGSTEISLNKEAPVAECRNDASSETAKYFQESCSNDTDCFDGPTAMVCKAGTCQCVDGHRIAERFVGEKAIQTVCVKAPGLFEQCEDICQKPATCLQYTGEDAKGKHVKVCQCAKPYALQDGECIINCGDKQNYDEIKYRCLPRCKANEVRDDDKCLPLVGLKGKCQAEQQCQVAFSECKSGVCVCLDSFDEKNSLCLPKQINCPDGSQGLKIGDGFFKMCKVASDNKGNNKDDCAAGFKCFKQPSEQSGFCCKTWENKCPVGSPHPTATCDGKSDNVCPEETHVCKPPAYLTGVESDLCCPKQCSTGTLFINGKCYAEAKFDDNCIDDLQCSQTFSKCVGGVCSCEPGTKSNGKYPNTYCSRVCDETEVLSSDDTCEKRFKLGESCTNETEYRCPDWSYCNKNNKCACKCGTFKLADDTCAPDPECGLPPLPITYRSNGVQALPSIPKIPFDDPEKRVKNVTFCKVDGENPPKGVKVGKCRDDKYCTSYISNLGLCCPKPKPICPGGGKILNSKQCDILDPLSCGLNNICVKYAFAVDIDDSKNDNTICCSDE